MAVENGGAGTVSRRPTMGAHNLADHTRSQREAQECTATLMSSPISSRRPHGASDFASSGMATSWRESLAGKVDFCSRLDPWVEPIVRREAVTIYEDS